jgi:hypothetical protein
LEIHVRNRRPNYDCNGGACTGAGWKHRGLYFDPELLYAAAMFHDLGLTPRHYNAQERFEVDSAYAARTFLRSRGVALHTTPGIAQHMHPVVALVTAGVQMDVLSLTHREYSDVERKAVTQAHPRGNNFKEAIIRAFYAGIKRKPETTFGRGNFCTVIREAAWPT